MKKFVRLQEYLKEGTLVSRYNIKVVGLLGAVSHLLFYFIYKYGFSTYENIWLRLTASLFCLSVMLMNRLPSSWHRFLSYHWHLTLIIVLPFIFTASLLMNNFHELWLFSSIAMIFILMMFVPNWLMFTLDLCLGVAGAIVFYLLSNPQVPLHPTFNIPLYGTVLGFSLFAGYIFSIGNWNSLKELERQKAEEKYLALEALAGSIAHEMRNPLSGIRHTIDEVLHELPQSNLDGTVVSVPVSSIEVINKRLNQAQMAVDRGLHVITMTLGNFRNTDVSHENLTWLSAVTMTRKAIEEYGYASEQERRMIHLVPGIDFLFLGEENNYMLVLYNLLVNAFDVLHPVPDGRIDITIMPGEKSNRISVRDNGPGIPPDILPKIFDPFFTSGKKGGTGLGLAFCQRMMHFLNGEITCKSEQGRYTEFTLEFPALDQATIKEYESKLYADYIPLFKDRRLLLAGIPEEHAPAFRRLLAPLNVERQEASDGNEVLAMIAGKRYDLILANAILPPLGIEELLKGIRKTGRDIPVIACSSSSTPSIENRKGVEAVIAMPPALPELLGALKTSLETVRETLRESLSGKTVLVADDLDFNRKVIRSMLGKLGVTILEATNGLEALEILKSQPCDLLIMDMRMPVLDGFETTIRIRTTHAPWRDIPILGLSGNLDNSTLNTAKECGMNDTLIKPLKLKQFQLKVSSMLKVGQPSSS